MSFFQRKPASSVDEDDFGNAKTIGVVCDTPSMRAIIQQGYSDISDLTGTSKGSLYVRVLYRGMNPIEGNEASYYDIVLLDAAQRKKEVEYPDKKGVSRALEAAFQGLCAGIGGRPRHRFGLPYVEFARDMAANHWLVLHEKLDEGPDPRVNLGRDYRYLKRYLKENGVRVPADLDEAIDSDHRPPIYPFIDLILANWELLENMETTYKFLMYLMAAADNWDDTAAERTRFRDVCLDISKDVQAEEAKRAAAREKERRDALLTTISMADGREVAFPKEWKVLNRDEAESARYAGVIEVRDPIRRERRVIKGYDDDRIPHFLFFRKEPVYEMTETDRAEITKMAIAEWPELSDIQARERKLEYGPDGGITNYQEFINAPAIGFFEIRDEASVTPSNPAPYGAVIRRRKGGVD